MTRIVRTLMCAAAVVFAAGAAIAEEGNRSGLGGPDTATREPVADNRVPHGACSVGPDGMCSPPAFDHIVVVIMENRNYPSIIGNDARAPFINGLAGNGALLTRYAANSHPSLPNYLALYAGSTFGITDDDTYRLHGATLATVLQQAGKSFVGFVERPYDKTAHNPWQYFPERRSVERDFMDFPGADFSALPHVAYVVPNLAHDMHDGSIKLGDGWLQSQFAGYVAWARTHNSLFIVLWDENSGSKGNLVPVIFAGAHVRPGVNDEPATHFNLLSTILATYGIAAPNNSATAVPIDVFSGLEMSLTHPSSLALR